MHSSRMRTARSLTISPYLVVSVGGGMLAMHTPLPCMPPAMHAPHAPPPAMHAPLPRMPPTTTTHAPLWTDRQV